MEYSINKRKPKNARFTIGYLDDNEYNEAYSQVMTGVCEAARKYGVNIIRFGYYSSIDAYRYTNQVQLVLDLIQQYDLDGLLFLGWTEAAAMYNHDDFLRRFGSIPLLSIGSTFEDIPNVYFPGQDYIREILLHLIEVHRYRKIAYIAPRQPDGRNTVYVETMKEHGIYDPQLFVTVTEASGFDSFEITKKALQILLDERKVIPDAILSLNSGQTWELLRELKRRGVEVPGDIAVTSYDDGYIGDFSVPSLTTVHYPWAELGYQGCEKMVELLTDGHIPFSTPVPSKIIYRDSCGCMQNMAGDIQSIMIKASGPPLAEISAGDKKRIVGELEKAFRNTRIDFNKLLEAFLGAFAINDCKLFIKELELQFRSVLYNFDYKSMEDTLLLLRKLLLPYVISSGGQLVRFSNLIQQSHVFLREKLINTHGHVEVDGKNLNQTLQEISQALISKFSMNNLIGSLKSNLHRISIPSCYMVLFNSIYDGDAAKGGSYDQCLLKFEYDINSNSRPVSGKVSDAASLLSEIFEKRSEPFILFTQFLHVSDEFMGFIMFEQGPINESVYQALSVHISTALLGAILVERLENSYKSLIDQAYREGMADIVAGILHNIGNIFNSVNLSVFALAGLSASQPFNDLIKANNILRTRMDDLGVFFADDEKGRKLLRFYTLLGDYIAQYKDQSLFHLGRIENNINRINDIISAQQTYAGLTTVLEEVDLQTIVDDALSVNAASLEKYGITVERKLERVPRALVQRGKLFHTLINIINYSKESMADTPVQDRKLTISLFSGEKGKYIRITDTGRGIPPGQQKKIFEYDHSSINEERMLGLVSSASYMQEMGGGIWAESEGTGKGSSFTLYFPQ